MENYCSQKLSEVLAKRKSRNSAYSLRAMAKDLNINSSNLSAILKGKRGLPPHRAEEIANKLSLSAIEKSEFISSSYRKKYKLDGLKSEIKSSVVLDEDLHYDLIAKWEYYAVFELLKTREDGILDLKWISQKLDITADQARSVILTLSKLNFISIVGNTFQLEFDQLDTSFDISSEALQTSHQESFSIAKEKLKEVDVHLRDYSSLTIAISKDNIPVIKSLIREFQDKIYDLIDQPNNKKEEVYMLNTQFLPLTKIQGDHI